MNTTTHPCSFAKTSCFVNRWRYYIFIGCLLLAPMLHATENPFAKVGTDSYAGRFAGQEASLNLAATLHLIPEEGKWTGTLVFQDTIYPIQGENVEGKLVGTFGKEASAFTAISDGDNLAFTSGKIYIQFHRQKIPKLDGLYASKRVKLRFLNRDGGLNGTIVFNGEPFQFTASEVAGDVVGIFKIGEATFKFTVFENSAGLNFQSETFADVIQLQPRLCDLTFRPEPSVDIKLFVNGVSSGTGHGSVYLTLPADQPLDLRVEADGYWPVSTNLTLPAYDPAEWRFNLQSKESEFTISTEPKAAFHLRVRGQNGLDFEPNSIQDKDGVFKLPNNQPLTIDLITDDKVDFWSEETNVALTPSQNGQWNVKLVPVFTELTVATVPSTTFKLYDVGSGEHKEKHQRASTSQGLVFNLENNYSDDHYVNFLSIEADGYWPAFTNISLAPNIPASWTPILIPNRTELRVTPNPTVPFELTVNGITEQPINGNYRLINNRDLECEVNADGYWSTKTNLFLLPNTPATWKPVLLPNQTELRIVTEPKTEFNLLVNGEQQDGTNGVYLLPNNQTLTLTANAIGFHPVTTNFILSPNTPGIWKFDWPYAETRLKVLTEPAAAIVVRTNGVIVNGDNGIYILPTKTQIPLSIQADGCLVIDKVVSLAPYPNIGPWVIGWDKPEMWTNTLGMVFHSVPGTSVLFCVCDTRLQDYQAFADATHRKRSKPNGDNSRVVNPVSVNADEANAFCKWLTKLELKQGKLQNGSTYRLPTDDEWSGVSGQESLIGVAQRNAVKERFRLVLSRTSVNEQSHSVSTSNLPGAKGKPEQNRLLKQVTLPAGINVPDPALATRSNPLVNTLGMKFVPVPGTDVLFCIWDVRVQDYRTYAEANCGVAKCSAGWAPSDTHPLSCVSWNDAKAFCAWLSKKEGKNYRLPTDAEWSVAVGLPSEAGSTPKEKNMQIKDVYPWGTQWPPPNGAGNYADAAHQRAQIYPSKKATIEGYDDGYADTSPVGSFAANKYGLYDMGGNVSQWCEDGYDGDQKERVVRGSSYFDFHPSLLLSSSRHTYPPDFSTFDLGFRCVLVIGASAAR